MKNRAAFVMAALVSFSAAARAAEVNFDGTRANGALDLMQEAAELKAQKPPQGPQQSPKPPKPGHPGHPGWNPNMPPPPPPPAPRSPPGLIPGSWP